LKKYVPIAIEAIEVTTIKTQSLPEGEALLENAHLKISR
jgi:hypothetical protein